MTWLVDGRPVRRALVTRLRYLGDVVMSTVVIDALRRGDAALEIGYLCEEAHAPVLAGHSDLARVHALAVRRHGGDARARSVPRGAPEGDLRAQGAAGTVRALRTCRYDLAVDLFFNPRSAWLLALAGIRCRLAGPAGSRGWLYAHQSAPRGAGADERWPRLAPGGLGEHLSRLAPLVHRESGLGFIDWYLESGRVACPGLARRPDAGTRVAGLLASRGLPPAAPFVLLAPGATWPTKRWPQDHWAELGKALAATWPGSVVTLTPPGEGQDTVPAAPPAAAPAEAPGTRRAATLPVLPLPDVMDVLQCATALVTVDGGVMHTAVGLGTPTLGLFGPTDPVTWFPYEATGPYRVLATRPPCHPCHLHACDAFVCLPDLAPATVLAALRDMLAGRQASSGGGCS